MMKKIIRIAVCYQVVTRQRPGSLELNYMGFMCLGYIRMKKIIRIAVCYQARGDFSTFTYDPISNIFIQFSGYFMDR